MSRRGVQLSGSGRLSDNVLSIVGGRPGEIDDILRERGLGRFAAKERSLPRAVLNELKDAVMVDKVSANGIHFTTLYFDGQTPKNTYEFLRAWHDEFDDRHFGQREYEAPNGEVYQQLSVNPSVADTLTQLCAQKGVTLKTTPFLAAVRPIMAAHVDETLGGAEASAVGAAAAAVVFSAPLGPKSAEAVFYVGRAQRNFVSDALMELSSGRVHTPQAGAANGLTAYKLTGGDAVKMAAFVPRAKMISLDAPSSPATSVEEFAAALCDTAHPGHAECHSALQHVQGSAKGHTR